VKNLDRELVVGSVWEHYRGGLYKIVALGILDPNGEKCVLYCNSNNQLFIQTEARFLALTGVAEKGSFPVLLTIRYAYRFVKVLPVSQI
jgi:hypothetical protein